MSEARQRLAAALAGRYTVERELGRGGMATVYLATDVRHHRAVAIKVMHDEIAAEVGAARFLREIEIAASLTHPNILPLLDSGETSGEHSQPFYVMPFVEGESLRDRIAREGQLPVDDCVRLAREVADALQYAHDHGVVHRDIKPENILLAGGHAIVADFGVARALTPPGGQTLTRTGMSIGTPEYMSPEQAAADSATDGRSDIYALGTVLYEMLAGTTPWHGATIPAMLARKMAGAPPSLRVVRPTLPDPVERAVFKALEVAPADRFPTPRAFAAALGSAVTPVGTPATAPAHRSSPARVVAGAAILAVLALAGWKLLHREPSVAVDAHVVAVLPFRVSGADTSVARYRTGMLELLHAAFNGEGGPRAVSPATVLSAWRRSGGTESEDLPDDQALALARRLGAGRLLTGSITPVPGKLVIQATLLRVDGGNPIEARAEGPPDSVLAVVDRLVTSLLVQGSIGAARPQLGSLTTTSLPALRAFLDGQAAYRRGDFVAASKQFRTAIEIDSSFALAGMGFAKAAGWVGGGGVRQGLVVAWRGRDRLSVRDRTQLEEYAGPRFPGPVFSRDQLRSVERLVQLAPDDPEAWFELGDVLFHFGAQLELADAGDRARQAFERSVSLDSGFAAPLNHLIDLTGARGDSAGVRRFFGLRRRLAEEGGAPVPIHLWWRYALGTGDRALLDSLHRSVESGALPGTVLADAAVDAEDLQLAEAGYASRWRTATGGGRFIVGLGRVQLADNQGQPARAEALIDSLEALPGNRWPTAQFLRVTLSVYGSLDTLVAARAAAALAVYADTVSREGAERDRWRARAAVQLWRASGGDHSGLERVIQLGKAVVGSPDSANYGMDEAMLLAMLEAMAESKRGGTAALGRLDSLLARGPQNASLVLGIAGLQAAWLWEANGNPAAALRAVRRRIYDYANSTINRGMVAREEGRLAALTGDKGGAIDAYQRYLRFRANAEPALVPERQRIKVELGRLVGEPP